jgi:hypothetical protein
VSDQLQPRQRDSANQLDNEINRAEKETQTLNEVSARLQAQFGAVSDILAAVSRIAEGQGADAAGSEAAAARAALKAAADRLRETMHDGGSGPLAPAPRP